MEHRERRRRGGRPLPDCVTSGGGRSATGRPLCSVSVTPTHLLRPQAAWGRRGQRRSPLVAIVVSERRRSVMLGARTLRQRRSGARVHCRGPSCTSAGARAPARMMRETCICETPMRSPISACVRSSAKRRRRTSRSRGVIDAHERARSSRDPRPREAALLVADGVAEGVAALVVGARWRLQRRGPVGAGGFERLEHVLLVGADLRADLGDRRLAVRARASSSETARSTFSASSCRSRGTRTDHVRSRK